MNLMPICSCVALASVFIVLLAGCQSPSPRPAASQPIVEPALPARVQGYLNIPYDHFAETRLHLFVPENAAGKPIVIYIHGGGWNGGSLDQYDSQCVRTASIGLASATIEYRFLDKVPLRQIVGDVAKACAFLRSRGQEYGYDGSRMFLLGSSAGGHLSLVVGARAGELSKEFNLSPLPEPIGVIAQCPVTDLTKRPESVLAGSSLVECSPMHIPAESFPAVLVQHGDQDDTVPLADSQRFVDRLKQAQRPVRLSIVAGSGHAFGYNLVTKPGAATFAEALQFIRQTMAGGGS